MFAFRKQQPVPNAWTLVHSRNSRNPVSQMTTTDAGLTLIFGVYHQLVL